MPKEQSPGKPTTRRYSAEEKAAAAQAPVGWGSSAPKCMGRSTRSRGWEATGA